MSISSVLSPVSASCFPFNMMYNGANSIGKRKLEQIIADLSTSPPSLVSSESLSKEEEENQDHNSKPVLKPKKKLKTTDESDIAKEEPLKEAKMESDESQETNSTDVASGMASLENNPIVESIRADFMQQQLQAISTAQQQQQDDNASSLRDQLLEPATYQLIHSSSSPSPQQDSPNQSSSDHNNNNNSTNPVKVTNVYRGLYPIKNVKEYFKKKTIDNQKLYICQWPGCTFQTWKYSQHISRHIYLKHIGIKELKCQVANCEKVFKRPESLVQHVKNHICGFGIDPIRMKDPNNTCGVKNIKKHFNKIMDNDIQVFMCQFDKCKFVTNNSGSIRRHVHNQHICPHSSPAAAAAAAASHSGHNGTTSRANRQSAASSHSVGSPSQSNPQQVNSSVDSLATVSSPYLNHFTSGSGSNSSSSNSNTPDEESSPAFGPLVVLTEYEGQTYDPVNRSINHQSIDGNQSDDADSIADMPIDFTLPRQMTSSVSAKLNRIDEDDDEQEDNEQMSVDESQAGQQSLASLQMPNGHFLGLPQTMGTGPVDPVAFAAFAGIPSTSTSTPTIHAYLKNHLVAGTSGMASAPLPVMTSGSSDPATAAAEAAAAAAARRKNNGLYSLKNYKEYYYKIRTPESGVQFICKGCKFQAKSQITLIRHLWNELGYKEFHCEFEGCSRTFDNEFSRYKHRKFDHGQPNQAQAVGVVDPTVAIMPAAAGPADSSSMALLGLPNVGAQDRFSPIPPLVPMPTQAQMAPNSSYNTITTALLNLGHPASTTSMSIPSTTYLPTYLPPSGMFAPITTTSGSLIPPPSTHHLTLASNPMLGLPITTFAPTSTMSGIPPLVDRIVPSFAPISQSSISSPRRHSNSSASSSTTSGPVNSSLISILQAPSVASSSANLQIPTTQIPTTFGTPNHLNLLGGNPLLSEPSSHRPSFPSPRHSTPLSNGTTSESSKAPKSGSYSLKQYSDQYEKIPQPNGDTLYRCTMCENYWVRSHVSIVKHLMAHMQQADGDRAMSPSGGGDPRPRTSSMLSSGAFSSGGEIDNEDEDDQEISVEDDEVNVTSEGHGMSGEAMLNGAMFANAMGMDMGDLSGNQSGDKAGSSGAQASMRKYNCRSKSGLYSLKKHENDYIRSKGPDGYHYKCANCDEYTTKSQASMVRHIWTHKKQNFRCDCGESFENEFSLYKHKKTTHPELTSQHNRSSSKNSSAKAKAEASTSTASTSTANANALNSATTVNPAMVPVSLEQFNESGGPTSDQLQQQQQFLSWLQIQQQFIVMQQMQQQQQQQQQQQAGTSTSNPVIQPDGQMLNFAQYLYQNLQANGALEPRDADMSNKSESEEEDETKSKPEPNQKGMSRRALRFKSTKHKPVQIKQEEAEEDKEKGEPNKKHIKNGNDEDDANDSSNELSIDEKEENDSE